MQSGCRKKNDPTYIPENVKSYTVFQVGSYWIFKNEVTGSIDSTYISEAPHYFFNGDEYIPPYAEACAVRYGGAILSVSMVSPGGVDLWFLNGTYCQCLQFYNDPPGANSNFTNIKTFDSLEVNNKYYHEVINTESRIRFANGDTLFYTFYIAKSVGIIKLDKRKNEFDTTWSLIRSHVVQ